MKSAREPIWWLPITRRIVRWGAVMAFLVNLLPLLIVACFAYSGAFRNTVLPPDTPLWDGVVMSLFFAGVFTCPFALAGAIIGWASGFWAPSGEPTNSLKSSFLRVATAQTLGVWAVACVFVGAGLFCAYLLFFNRPPLYWRLTLLLTCFIFAIPFVLFALSLWRAINFALRVAKLNAKSSA